MRIAPLALAVVLPLAAGLAACVSAPAPRPQPTVGEMPSNKVWARADGQRMAGNPALLKKGQTDLNECRQQAATGEANKYVLDVLNSCMTDRGYVERERPGA